MVVESGWRDEVEEGEGWGLVVESGKLRKDG